MVLDCVRTCVIWGVSLLIGWEDFQYLQLIGFVILVYGTTVYNDIFKIPFFPYPELEDDELNDPLIAVPEMREPLIEEPSTKVSTFICFCSCCYTVHFFGGEGGKEIELPNTINFFY